MRPVAFVTCEKHPNLTPDDRRLIEPMSKAGFRIEPAIWNAPGIDWKNFDSVVLRSPWDYYLKFEKFVHWLKDLEALGVELWNPYEVIHWNTRKSYLREFEKQGIRIPPTEWIEQGSSPDILSILRKRGWDEVVLKPSVSAGGHDTFRMKAVDAPKHASRIHQIAQSSEVLIQPFLPEVETEGEWSFLFFGGEFSHAILKKPAPGNFLVQAEHGGSVIPVKARQEWVRTARSVLDLVSTPLLYARVDMIQVSGELVLGELEITEPALYLEYDSNAAERFASAFRRFRN